MAWSRLERMSVQHGLRQAIDQQQSRLRAAVPLDRQAAIFAILGTREQMAYTPDARPLPDLITGPPLADPGGNLALRLCLEATDDAHSAPMGSEGDVERWAEWFLLECGRVAQAELVVTHVETGFMRLVDAGEGEFAAWIATKRTPASWRERADIAWWASWLATGSEMPSVAPHAADPDDARFRRLAAAQVRRMSYQLGYPADAPLGEITIQTYRDVLESLVARVLSAQERGASTGSWVERDLAAALGAELTLDPDVIGRVVTAFTLNRENAAWHAAVPGVAAAPLVRVAPDRLAWSAYGLTTEPFFFLARELRRRDAREYNTRAHPREDVFRRDLYALFTDPRFVTAPRPIALRREGGNLGADVDAVVFDRKTGALGLFELKSQDPYARSAAELARQQDNLLYANRQLSGVLTWLNRHGGDALLSRVDARIAKRFRVQKVLPFVLGRYLAPVGDGPEPDRRAAWGSWPQVLRLLDGQTVSATANPLASLYARLRQDAPVIHLPADIPARVIALGRGRLTVFPSYAAYRTSAAENGQ